MYSTTYTGLRFEFEDPTPAMIDPEDLAHALANTCRFSGHVRKFYSVAQHLVLSSCQVSTGLALKALLHDAPEAYLCDLPRYLKRAEGMEGYSVYEEKTWNAVCRRFGILEDLPNEIKTVDHRMVLTEWRDLMSRPLEECLPEMVGRYQPYDFEIIPWSPERAELEFKYRLGGLWKPTSS